MLDYPIVSGNVSLYNESKATGGGSAILPTPAIGGVGLLADYSRMATIAFKAAGEAIYLIGSEPWATPGHQRGHLGQSLWLREIHGREDGDAPPVDLHIVPSADPPTGMGECGVPPIAPAIANAVAALTGKRWRSLPFPA